MFKVHVAQYENEMRVTIVCLDVPHTVKVRCRTAGYN